MTDFDNQFDEGLRAYQQGDYPAAQRLFEALLTVRPYASEVHLNLGNVHYKLNDLTQAEACFRKALELDPVEGNAYLNLGNLCFKQERFEEAVHYWEIFKTLDRTHANTWLNLGLAYDRLGDPDKALESYSGFIARSPDAPETPRIISRFDQAKKVFEHNIKIADDLLKQGKEAQAREIFGKALKSYPGNAAIYKTYASLLYRNGEWQAALNHYRKAYEKKQDDVSVLINLGVLYEKLNRPFSALWAYQTAHALPGPEQNQLAQRIGGLLRQHQSRLPDALAKAQSLFRQGKWRQAEELLQQLSALSDYFPDKGAELKALLDTVQEALNPAQKAAKTYLARAQDAEASGKFDHALNFYNKLLALQPHSPAAESAKQNIARIQAIMSAAIRSFLQNP
ncbi:MAG TPA: tetratricopeptide repeat protein [Oculatellaceae cyanobacterium]